MDPVTIGLAAGTMGVGLLQGMIGMEQEKRKLALDRYKFNIEHKENRFNQEMAVRQQQTAFPVQSAQQQSGTLQGLMSALGGVR